jgi:hypothetical protein
MNKTRRLGKQERRKEKELRETTMKKVNPKNKEETLEAKNERQTLHLSNNNMEK